jgi:hypothetical protein
MRPWLKEWVLPEHVELFNREVAPGRNCSPRHAMCTSVQNSLNDMAVWQILLAMS